MRIFCPATLVLSSVTRPFGRFPLLSTCRRSLWPAPADGLLCAPCGAVRHHPWRYSAVVRGRTTCRDPEISVTSARITRREGQFPRVGAPRLLPLFICHERFRYPRPGVSHALPRRKSDHPTKYGMNLTVHAHFTIVAPVFIFAGSRRPDMTRQRAVLKQPWYLITPRPHFSNLFSPGDTDHIFSAPTTPEGPLPLSSYATSSF